jgi:ERCC4-type nuclease
MDYLCPIIVERKSVQDVAMSIYDGRWNSQKRRMYQGQYVFGYENCRMVYIIEGNQNAQTVSGGYVGARWYDVNKERLAEEVENLKAEGFEVLQTPSREQCSN